ncbi:xanthine dehydrogenase family protein molybdopterin-binding subunit [Marinicella rhabdoformis]|uniref:xanthine dehydrogenase family protein molybdopterin-binding subunit n=1 Tax=Marinicella rhabdoformis TaxID=2580566 RepID=UPI0012AED5D1|nr:molybdopterin cofactor-binding domain-containing protein [Marinicella rhabdoformis]
MKKDGNLTNSKIKKVTRRSFLQGVGLSAGGLTLGLQFSVAQAATDAVTLEHKPFEPDVFVSIAEDGQVTVISHRSEMGQGIRSTLPMLVADELEADWDRVTVEQGLGDTKYGSQNTDGSRSVRKNYIKLKQAGATARTMLQQAAAKIWSVPVGDVTIYNHQAKHASKGTLDFADLVKVAATLDVPTKDTLKLKTEAEHRYVGKDNMALLDGKDIITGRAMYGFDTELPGMKYAVIARPPVVYGKVKSFDDSETLKVPGVIKTVELPALTPPVMFKMLGGVAVIAENTWAALQGRDKLKIEWDHGKNANYNTKEHEAVFIKALENPTETPRVRGDFDAAKKAAKQTIKAAYHVAGLAHATMEPPAATAQIDGDIVNVWACTQTPQGAQTNVMGTLAIAKENIANIKINVTLLGGGFGRKSKPDYVAEAAFLAKESGLPIKVQWTREDEIKHGYYHSPSYQELEASLDENNNVTGWSHAMVNHPIMSTFNPMAKAAGMVDLGLGDVMYDIPNIKIALGETETFMRIGWVRSVTNINNVFAASSFADELAVASKVNPKDYLLQLIGKDQHVDFSKDNYKYTNYGESITDYPADTSRLKHVINLVAEKSGWDKKSKNGGLPKGHGIGIAAHRSFLSYVAIVVHVSTDGNKVKIEDIHMAADIGKVVNPDRVRSQLEGAAMFGASIAFYGEITAKDGIVEQNNFNDYQLVRMNQIPTIHTHLVASEEKPTGVGEPGVPPFAPALCNAIYNATGNRNRRLPMKHLSLV